MNSTLGFINSIIQLFAIFSFQYFALVWPLYIVMSMLGLLILLQTIAAAGTFAGIHLEKEEIKDRNSGLVFLVSSLYLVSCYTLSLAGFSTFAIVGAAHATIMLISSFFMWSRS